MVRLVDSTRDARRRAPNHPVTMLNRRSFLGVSLAWPLLTPLASCTSLLRPADRKAGEREEMLTQDRPTTVGSLAEAIVIKNENLFFVAQPDGNVPNVPPDESHGLGLYYHDCRYLNGYEIRLAGQKPSKLAASSTHDAIGVFTLTNPALELEDGRTLEKERIGITWRRVIESDLPALRERLLFQNFSADPVSLSVELTFNCAFEDLYAVRGLVDKHLGLLHEPAWHDGALRFAYDGQDGVSRTLTIFSEPQPNRRRGKAFEFTVRLAPRARQQVDLLLMLEESRKPKVRRPHPGWSDLTRIEADIERATQAWIAQITQVSSNGSALDQLMERSFRGLRVLRTHLNDETYFAAGVPWFVTLFGRDSLLTAYQMLAYHPLIAEQTLRLLAKYQGTREDDWRDEQPGKILHELRIGELAHLDIIPHTPFYGTVDATPLFLLLIAEHAGWSGTLDLFHELRVPIDRALHWMDHYGDRHGETYLTYVSRTKERMINKGWKDSGNAIVNADGSLAQPPIALAEVQGYAYAAKLGIADLFERAGERERAARLRREAQRLRERFNRDFWMEENDCYALALQADGRPAAVISSNPGQALWTGITDEDNARRTIRRLMQDDMYSGWGVRTLSSREPAYNPISYHRGTVWPHDNSIIAAGFRRYGADRDALRIFHGLADAAFYFPSHQLPELFCGFSRQEYDIPINYPVACHPQAWASGTIPFLLVTLLGLTPEAFDKRLRIVRPQLPDFLDGLELRRLRVGQARADLRFQRYEKRVEVEVLGIDGELNVTVEADE